jgi:hypothetical protein
MSIRSHSKVLFEEKQLFLFHILIERQVQEPRIRGQIDITSAYGTQVHLDCPNRNANIYYTFDGSHPKRFDNKIYVNNNEKQNIVF